MRRHWFARLLSGCLAVWFTLSVGEPSFARVCPMHSSAMATRADMDGMPGMAPDHGDAGDAGDHAQRGAQHRAPGGHSQSPTGRAHHCSCIDCCVGAGNSGLAATPVAFVTAGATQAVERVSAGAPWLPRSTPAHALPPGTGPPRI